MAAIGAPSSGGNCLAAMTMHSMSERVSVRMLSTKSSLLMGSSYAAGLPFHIIADARAAFERLVKGLTEAVREQRLAGPEPQIPASASSTSSASRLRIIEKTKSAITSAGGAALDSSRRHRSRSVSFAVMGSSYFGRARIDGLRFGSRRLLITRDHHHRIVDLALSRRFGLAVPLAVL